MYSAVLESFDKKDFLKMFRAVSELYETDAVFSGSGYGDEDRSVLFIAPSDVLKIKEETGADVIKSFAFSDGRETFGYLSYDYGLLRKGLPSAKERYSGYGMLKKYKIYAEHRGDKLTVLSDSEIMTERIIEAYESYAHKEGVSAKSGGVTCSMDSTEYISKTAEVIGNIRDGEVYQLNLSMMYEAAAETGPALLWADIAERHPAPFYAYMNTDEGVILSTSPERFLKAEEGAVLSQPIKGTLRFDEYSEGLEELLTGSEKESAELSMIVDLIRNDISETCAVGSVKVENHKSVMRVDNLLQMYSDVRGVLADGKDVVDLLITAFPGGSVTGCPKRRAMELIEVYEPHSRGVYCGSIFTIKDRLNMDSSIAIRTAFYKDGRLRFFAGSGIVADSVPESEYRESVSKAEKFLGLFI